MMQVPAEELKAEVDTYRYSDEGNRAPAHYSDDSKEG